MVEISFPENAVGTQENLYSRAQYKLKWCRLKVEVMQAKKLQYFVTVTKPNVAVFLRMPQNAA